MAAGNRLLGEAKENFGRLVDYLSGMVGLKCPTGGGFTRQLECDDKRSVEGTECFDFLCLFVFFVAIMSAEDIAAKNTKRNQGSDGTSIFRACYSNDFRTTQAIARAVRLTSWTRMT